MERIKDHLLDQVQDATLGPQEREQAQARIPGVKADIATTKYNYDPRTIRELGRK